MNCWFERPLLIPIEHECLMQYFREIFPRFFFSELNDWYLCHQHRSSIGNFISSVLTYTFHILSHTLVACQTAHWTSNKNHFQSANQHLSITIEETSNWLINCSSRSTIICFQVEITHHISTPFTISHPLQSSVSIVRSLSSEFETLRGTNSRSKLKYVLIEENTCRFYFQSTWGDMKWINN